MDKTANPKVRANRVHTYEQIRDALLKYRDLNGHIIVPYKFRVPTDTSDWAEVRNLYACSYIYLIMGILHKIGESKQVPWKIYFLME